MQPIRIFLATILFALIAATGAQAGPAPVQQCKKGNGGTAATNYTVTIASSGGTTGCTLAYTSGDALIVGYSVGPGPMSGTISDLTSSSISATGATITWHKAGSIGDSIWGSDANYSGILYACAGDITSPTSSIAVTVNMGASYAGLTAIFVQEAGGILPTGCYDSNSAGGQESCCGNGTFSTNTSSTLSTASEFMFATGCSFSGSGIAITAGAWNLSPTGSVAMTIPAQGQDSESASAEFIEYAVTSATNGGYSSASQSPSGTYELLVQAGFIAAPSVARHRIIDN